MRTGQTWLCYLLAHALNARMIEPYCLLRGIVYVGNSYVRSLTGGGLPGTAGTKCKLVVKTHEHPDPNFSLTRKTVLIVRDPRDTVTSAALRYHVMKTTGTDVEEDAQRLSLISTPPKRPSTIKDRVWKIVYGNRLLAVMLTARKWAAFNESWRQIPFVEVVKFEDLVRETGPELSRLCRRLGIEVAESTAAETAHLLSMAEIKLREATADSNRSIGFRSGAVGDFAKHLSRLELAIVRYYCRRAAAAFGYEL